MFIIFIIFIQFLASLAPKSNGLRLSQLSLIFEEEEEESYNPFSPEDFFSKKDITHWVTEGLSYDALCCFVQSNYAEMTRILPPESKQLIHSDWKKFIDLLTSHKWDDLLFENCSYNDESLPEKSSLFPDKLKEKLKVYAKTDPNKKKEWNRYEDIINKLSVRINENKSEIGISNNEEERKSFYTQILNSLNNYLLAVFENEGKNEDKLKEDIQFFCCFIETFNNACPQRLAQMPSVIYLKTIVKKMEMKTKNDHKFSYFISKMLPLYIEHLIGVIANSILIKENRYFQDSIFMGVHGQESYKYYAQELGYPLTYRRVKDPLGIIIKDDMDSLQKVNESIQRFLKNHLTCANFMLEFVLPTVLGYDSFLALDSEITAHGKIGLGASVATQSPTRNNAVVDELKRFLNLDSYQIEVEEALKFHQLSEWFKKECLLTSQNKIIPQNLTDKKEEESELWGQIMENYVLPEYIIQKGIEYFTKNPQYALQRNSFGYFFLFHISQMSLDIFAKKRALTKIFESNPKIACQDSQEGHTLLSVMVHSPFINNEELTDLIEFVLTQLCKVDYPQVQNSFWNPANQDYPYTLDGYCQGILVSLLENRLVQHYEMLLKHTTQFGNQLFRSHYCRYTNRSKNNRIYMDILNILLVENNFPYARPFNSLQYILKNRQQFPIPFEIDLLSVYSVSYISAQFLSRLINEFYPTYFKEQSTKKTLEWLKKGRRIFLDLGKGSEVNILNVILSFLEKSLQQHPLEVLCICNGFYILDDIHHNQNSFFHWIVEEETPLSFSRWCQFIKKVCNEKGCTQMAGLDLLEKCLSLRDSTINQNTPFHLVVEKNNVEMFAIWCQLMEDLCHKKETRERAFNIIQKLLSLPDESAFEYNFFHKIANFRRIELFDSWCQFMRNLCAEPKTRNFSLLMVGNLLSLISSSIENATFLHTVAEKKELNLWKQTNRFLVELEYRYNIKVVKKLHSKRSESFDTIFLGKTPLGLWSRAGKKQANTSIYLSKELLKLHKRLVEIKGNQDSFFEVLKTNQNIWNTSFDQRSLFLSWEEKSFYKKKESLMKIIFSFKNKEGIPDWLINQFLIDEVSIRSYLKYTGEILLWSQRLSPLVLELSQKVECTEEEKAIQSSLIKQGFTDSIHLSYEQIVLHQKMAIKWEKPLLVLEDLETFKLEWDTSPINRNAFLFWKTDSQYDGENKSLLQIILSISNKDNIPEWLLRQILADGRPFRHLIKEEEDVSFKLRLESIINPLKNKHSFTQEERKIQTSLIQQGYMKANIAIHRSC